MALFYQINDGVRFAMGGASHCTRLQLHSLFMYSNDKDENTILRLTADNLPFLVRELAEKAMEQNVYGERVQAELGPLVDAIVEMEFDDVHYKEVRGKLSDFMCGCEKGGL